MPLRRLAGAALIALIAGTLVRPAVPASAATPPLAVRVQGNSLVDGAGRPLRLLGVDRSGSEYACVQGWGIFDGPADAASIAAIAAWHVNAVRVPLNEDCWLAINGVNSAYAGTAYRSAITTFVNSLHQAGLVVILDLHWNAPGTTLATGQQVMADADHAPAFWSSVAGAFKNDPAVVFDLYNEPHDISWACWRDGCTTPAGWQVAGMQSLVNAVRSTGAAQPLMLGGLGWSSDLSSWLAYRPTDPANQEAASFHVYNFSGCNAAACWSAQVAPVAASFPVVTGEIGEDDCGSGFINSYMAWADARGVSYLGWTWDTWDCRSGPALITAYDGTPTTFGAGFRDHLAILATPPGNFLSPTDGEANVDTTEPFTWSPAPGAQAYLVAVGITRDGAELGNSGFLPPSQTSFPVGALPTGMTLYATIFTEVAGAWAYQSVAFTVVPGATFAYPVNGQQHFDPAHPFTWNTVAGAENYYLVVGTTPFGIDVVNSGFLPASQSTYVAPPLPGGKVLWAMLMTKVNGAWSRYQVIAFQAS